MTADSPLTLAVAAVVAVVGVARATRLVTHDTWPPAEWARNRFLGWAEQTRTVHDDTGLVPRRYEVLTWRAGWTPLVTCPFCVAPWIALLALAAGIWAGVWSPDLGSWAGWWWVLAVWAAVSYAASMVVVRDEPPEGD